MLGAIAGHDPNDSTSVPVEVPDYRSALTGDISGMRIGIAREFAEVEGMEPGVAGGLRGGLRRSSRRSGRNWCRCQLPHSKYALPTYYITAPAEASANLARFDGVKYGLSVDAGTVLGLYLRDARAGVRAGGQAADHARHLRAGSGYYDAYYVKAQKVRTLIKRDFDEAFKHVDVILAPTSPTVAFQIGARSDDPLQMYLADIFTIPANMAGLPGIAIPCGFSEGLPVSLQVLGRAFGEANVLRAAHAYEQAAVADVPADASRLGGSVSDARDGDDATARPRTPRTRSLIVFVLSAMYFLVAFAEQAMRARDCGPRSRSKGHARAIEAGNAGFSPGQLLRDRRLARLRPVPRPPRPQPRKPWRNGPDGPLGPRQPGPTSHRPKLRRSTTRRTGDAGWMCYAGR